MSINDDFSVAPSTKVIDFVGEGTPTVSARDMYMWLMLDGRTIPMFFVPNPNFWHLSWNDPRGYEHYSVYQFGPIKFVRSL